MKLVNFASLDPAIRARGLAGLSGASTLDRAVWTEFQDDWQTAALASERHLSSMLGEPAGASVKELAELRITESLAGHPTEATASVKVRTMQHFFRKVVLAAHGWQCCISGNPVRELLVASHILPWSKFPKERLDPRNGLCLAAQYDRAFDCGLITVGKNLEVHISSSLRAYLPNDAVERDFIKFSGAKLRLPERFQPNQEFLAYHRREIYRK